LPPSRPAPQKFNAWLDKELEEGPQASLLVYPEGTRSQKDASLPLKRGMPRYAFTRRLPVQVGVPWGLLLALPGLVVGWWWADGVLAMLWFWGAGVLGCLRCCGAAILAVAASAVSGMAPTCCAASVPPSPSILSRQAVVTAHKEEVLNERRRYVHFGRTLVTGFSGAPLCGGGLWGARVG
jgi:hypothetical protein